MKEIVIANIMRAKNKQSFFALHQIYNKIKAFDESININFHVLWDENNECKFDDDKKWADLIDNYGFNITSYNKKFFRDYWINAYDYDEKLVTSHCSKMFSIYFILMAHYLRRVKLYDYYLIYDDDILINYDFSDIITSMLEKRPVLVSEPMNSGCDKVLFNRIQELYGQNIIDIYTKRNPHHLGFNAGFQGIDLSIYDDFLCKDRFDMLINLFNYSGIYDENGKEIWGPKRSLIDTQQQSFFGIMNVIKSKKVPYILNPNECYIIPNWGVHPVFGDIDINDENEGWTFALKSKITHFIGHTQGKGKPKTFIKHVDKYLRENNI